ncbi:MAG: hypothetical protein HQL52_03475 [Magnetococcales bacterium]|nr:hypothetical protein [Magnetococcales bacterium]
MKWIFALLFFLPFQAFANPGLYCLMDFGGKQCHWPDLASCQKMAGESGSCFLNQEEMIAPTGGSPWCVVESWRTECIYQVPDNCETQARIRKATCIKNPNYGTSWQPAPTSGETEKGPSTYLPAPVYQPRPGYR